MKRRITSENAPDWGVPGIESAIQTSESTWSKLDPKQILFFIFLVISISAGLAFIVWQYNLCMEKDLGMWYCIKHAM